MDNEPKKHMIPADKALSYIWVRYVLFYIHPFFAGCCAFLMDVLWAGWTKDYYPQNVSSWLIFFLLCFFIAVGIKVATYHSRAFTALNKSIDYYIDGSWGVAPLAIGWGIWHWIIIGPIFWPSIFPKWSFYGRNFIE